MRGCAVLVLLLSGQTAWAAPETSLRPVTRGGDLVQPVELAPSGAIEQPARSPESQRARSHGGIASSLRPVNRTRKAEKQSRSTRRLLAKGAVCGDTAIQGDAIGRVAARLSGCGVDSAVRVRSVAGVRLSQAAVMDCTTAKALREWVVKTARPALARKGGGLKGLRVAAHYACRTRNNQKGAKISEHGRGRAIDISGFTLADGSSVSVLQGWNAKSTSKALQRMHRGACGPFGTVLGPKANRFHRDHFHFDTARHRNGRYCR